MPAETQAGAGETEAKLLGLLEEYKDALWRLAGFYEGELSRREDLFQEIVLGLWKAIPSFRGDSSERTWLYRIAHNTAISALDARCRRARREVRMGRLPDLHAGIERPDDRLLRNEKRQAMLAAIHELPATDRQIIVLHLEGLSYEEIEQVAGLSQSAIATRLSRIRVRLTETVRQREVRHDATSR